MNYEIVYDKIAYFTNVFENIDEVTNLIEEINSKAITPWQIWYPSDSTKEEDAYGEMKTMCREFLKDESLEIKEKSSYLIETLVDAQIKAFIEYAKIYNLDQKIIENGIKKYKLEVAKIGINKYYTHKSMGPHVDKNDFNNRLLYTVIVYLNDDYDGGELYFKNFDIKIKPKAGSIVIFPSVKPYIHESLPVLTNRKMLITHYWSNMEHD